MIKSSELRIGNIVQDENGINQFVYRIWNGGCELSSDMDGNEDLDHDDDEIFGVSLTEEWALRLGFRRSPHLTIGNYLTKDIRQNRHISIGCINTPNEMIWLCEKSMTNDNEITDLICLRNYDYDGYTPVHVLQNIYHSIKGEELTIK